MTDDDGQILGWVSTPGTDYHFGALWLDVARRFPQTGLWPICDETNGIEMRRGWSDRDWTDPYALARNAFAALDLPDRLDLFGDDYGPRELLADFVPGASDLRLARAVQMPENPLSRLVEPRDAPTLTLVACQRPSDAALVLDFGIPNGDATPGIFAGVLRSWEERFSLVPTQLHQAWTEFQCVAPPQNEVDILRLAAEVVVFADDSAMQGGFHHREGGEGVSAEAMVRSREWAIWWD